MEKKIVKCRLCQRIFGSHVMLVLHLQEIHKQGLVEASSTALDWSPVQPGGDIGTVEKTDTGIPLIQE